MKLLFFKPYEVWNCTYYLNPPFEYAFYTVVANNDGAKELMQREVLKELAVVLTQKARESVSIDWTIKEFARANTRRHIKRILNKYGYPPDMQLLATENILKILKQAELIASELITT